MPSFYPKPRFHTIYELRQTAICIETTGLNYWYNMLSAYLIVVVGAPVVGFIPAVNSGAFSSNFRNLGLVESIGKFDRERDGSKFRPGVRLERIVVVGELEIVEVQCGATVDI